MTAARWGDWPTVALENEVVRVVAVPSLGARVVSLVDRRTGREWLVQGELPEGSQVAAWASEDAVFGGADAFGWDECLPTVAPCSDPVDPMAPPLRDHGDQWGRATASHAAENELVASWRSPRWPYTLRRTIRLDGPIVTAGYDLAVGGDRPLPFLWSMHALLALEPGAALVVEPAGAARLTHALGLDVVARSEAFAWPLLPTAAGGTTALDVVRGIEAGQAAKVYLDAALGGRVAARGVDGAELRFDWDREIAPTLGIWVDYGGWPPGEARHQVALEPTTSPDDDLGSAVAAGRARVVEPGRPLAWTVRLELVAGGLSPVRGP
jgi:hypothetical protein